jgi:NAD(P)-dependent dehydrogenase (short-subunit alcohol dehydrogenase family)
MNPSVEFQNRVVLVTGGTKGVGRGIAQAFLACGARVVVCGRRAPEAPVSVAGAQAEFVACDVREAGAVRELIDGIVSRHGRLDVLVSNAGGAPAADAASASPRFHEGIVRLNLLAPLHLAQAANGLMQRQEGGGVIVFIGSVSGLRPSPGTAAYGAAKAGVLSLATTLAVEWAPKVRVVAVSPGPVLTEQAHLHFGDAAGVAAVAGTIPAGRLAEPADVADACVFVASQRAAYMSGSNLLLHGGGERPAFLQAANARMASRSDAPEAGPGTPADGESVQDLVQQRKDPMKTGKRGWVLAGLALAAMVSGGLIASKAFDSARAAPQARTETFAEQNYPAAWQNMPPSHPLSWAAIFADRWAHH